jgi:peptidoglycan-associated lipoprotein
MYKSSALKFVGVCVLLCCVAMATGCHKKTPAAVAPAEVTAAPPAPPTPGPPECTLTAIPATVSSGQAVTLDWTSTNATKLNLKPALGPQQAEGSTSVTPTASTTYSVNVTGPGGAGECSARVTVTPPSAASVTESNLPPSNPGAAAVSNALQDAFFDFAKSDIRPDGQAALTRDASYLKNNPDVKIQIAGYCDQRGSEEYNLGLGERRADSAKTFLMNLGVAPDRITTISYGKDRPFCTEASEDCYQQNRRAHLSLVQQQ